MTAKIGTIYAGNNFFLNGNLGRYIVQIVGIMVRNVVLRLRVIISLEGELLVSWSEISNNSYASPEP